jgi:hypothetical protein
VDTQDISVSQQLLRLVVCLGFSADPRQTQDQNAGKSTLYTKPIPSHLPIHREHGTGYGVAQTNAAIAGATGSSFTLSDGTTITFANVAVSSIASSIKVG